MNGETGLTGDNTQAVLAVGEWVFGVPARQVVQVVPRPTGMAHLPRAGSRLAGVLPFRRHAVPVIDLRTWHQPAAALETAPSFIAVLSDGAHWVGLLVQEARGLVQVPAGKIIQLHHDHQTDEFFHSVATCDNGELLSLLDPARLMAQTQVWAKAATEDLVQRKAGDLPAADTAHDPSAMGGSLQERISHSDEYTAPFAVLRLGQGLYGLPTDCVAELINRPEAQSVWSSGDRLLGMMRWRGRDIPLVNPHAELGEPLQAGAPWVALLCDATQGPGGPVIGLPCNGLERVQRHPTQRVQSTTGAEAMAGTACTGLIQTPEGPLRLLDASSLVAQFAMQLDAPGASALGKASTSQPTGNPAAVVVFHARNRMAVPIGQLQSIEPLPDPALVAQAAQAPQPHTLLNWRGQALPLICLQQRLWPGQAIRTPYRRVLITGLNGQPCAWLIGEVEQLIAPQAGQITRIRLPEGRDLSIITHELASVRSSYEMIDFECIPGTA